MRKFASVNGADKSFGLRNKKGKFYIANKEAEIKENNIIVGDKEYVDMPGYGSLEWQQLQMIIFSPMGIMIMLK